MIPPPRIGARIIWSLAKIAAAVVGGGALVLAAVFLAFALGEDEPRREREPHRPQPVRVGYPARLNGIAYTVHRADRMEPFEPSQENRVWVIAVVGMVNTKETVSGTTRTPPRLLGGNGKVYRAHAGYSQPLFVPDLRPGFFQQRGVAFLVPPPAAERARLQLLDCPPHSRRATGRCPRAEFDLGLR
jgi:hypothetical protein